MLVSESTQRTQRAEGFKQTPFYFLAHSPGDAESDAERFSRLLQERKKDQVVEALRTVEPRLVDLVVLALRPSTVSADLGPGPLVPSSYMGQGFERLLMLILALLTSAGGVLFVDEIEDGLHYGVMVEVWKAIIAAAVKHDVQIFATTHSYECIEAAVKASAGVTDELAMYRLTRIDDRIRVVDVDDEGLRDAISLGFEMR